MHMLVPSCALHATLHPLSPLIPTNTSLYLLVHSHALYTYSWTYLIISSLYIIVNISWSKQGVVALCFNWNYTLSSIPWSILNGLLPVFKTVIIFVRQLHLLMSFHTCLCPLLTTCTLHVHPVHLLMPFMPAHVCLCLLASFKSAYTSFCLLTSFMLLVSQRATVWNFYYVIFLS